MSLIESQPFQMLHKILNVRINSCRTPRMTKDDIGFLPHGEPFPTRLWWNFVRNSKDARLGLGGFLLVFPFPHTRITCTLLASFQAHTESHETPNVAARTFARITWQVQSCISSPLNRSLPVVDNIDMRLLPVVVSSPFPCRWVH